MGGSVPVWPMAVLPVQTLASTGALAAPQPQPEASVAAAQPCVATTHNPMEPAVHKSDHTDLAQGDTRESGTVLKFYTAANLPAAEPARPQ